MNKEKSINLMFIKDKEKTLYINDPEIDKMSENILYLLCKYFGKKYEERIKIDNKIKKMLEKINEDIKKGETDE